MDPEFQRALTFVFIVGGIIAAIGGLAVVLIFRGFGGKTAGDATHIAKIVGLVSFVFLCCLLLFTVSYGAR